MDIRGSPVHMYCTYLNFKSSFGISFCIHSYYSAEYFVLSMDSNDRRSESHNFASVSGRITTTSLGEPVDVVNWFTPPEANGLEISIDELFGVEEDDTNNKRADKLLKDRQRRTRERVAFQRLCDVAHVDYYKSKVESFEEIYKEFNDVISDAGISYTKSTSIQAFKVSRL